MTIKFGEKTDVTISSGTNRIMFDATGAIGLRGANYGNVGDVITNDANGLPTWAAPSSGYGFNDVGNADPTLGVITVGNKQVLLNEASEIARAGITNGRSPIASISDIPVIPAIPTQAYHSVTINQFHYQGGVRNMSGFFNRITPVNINTSSTNPFTIPVGGAGVYLIGYGVYISGNYFYFAFIQCLINGGNSNQERLDLLIDNVNQHTNWTSSRSFVEQLNDNDTITFQTQVQGNGGQMNYRGQTYIMKIA